MNRYTLIEESFGYTSAPDPTNTDPRNLVVPSQNVLVDYRRKVKSRAGYTRLGAGNIAQTPVRNAWTWNTSTGTELMMRLYDDELEVYLGTVDGTDIDAWTRVLASWSTTEIMRAAGWWDATENIDLLLGVIGDANIYEWNGAVAVVATIPGSTSVAKAGTNTFAQNRFYTTRNKTFICVRTGTEYTYTGGETTTTLTGIADTAGLQAGDILIQKMVTNSNAPAASHANDTIFNFENQIVVGSFDDNEVWISRNTSFTNYTYSSPRVAGEGTLLTLDSPNSGLGALGKILIIFSGKSSIFRVEFTEITVGSILTEVARARKAQTGVNQGAFNPDCIIQIGDSIAYLSHEPAVRLITNPDQLAGLDPRTLSNPIKPDFDAENFTNAFGVWYKNSLIFSSPINSRLYINEWIEDADGKVRRYWQPPQILPVRAFSIREGLLYGHSNGVPETYNLFAEDTFSDLAYNADTATDEKLPIYAIVAFAYRTFGDRANQKTFDEYHVEGEISPQTTDLKVTLNYGFGGYEQSVDRYIDGTNQDILQETLLQTSLAQQPLGQQPLGGSVNAPANTAGFEANLEYAPEDFTKLQAVFSTNELDRYFAIISHGPAVRMSPRRNLLIHK